MLRIHFMQQWFALSDPAMEEALHDMPVFREFAGLEGWDERLPDESTILRFGMCWRSTSWPRRSCRPSTTC
jgi:IS5 family transposase